MIIYLQIICLKKYRKKLEEKKKNLDFTLCSNRLKSLRDQNDGRACLCEAHGALILLGIKNVFIPQLQSGRGKKHGDNIQCNTNNKENPVAFSIK